jgi:hypothetical protein
LNTHPRRLFSCPTGCEHTRRAKTRVTPDSTRRSVAATRAKHEPDNLK